MSLSNSKLLYSAEFTICRLTRSNYGVTDAALHDSQLCTDPLESTDKAVYADSAYSSEEIANHLPEGCEKGQKNHPLTE